MNSTLCDEWNNSCQPTYKQELNTVQKVTTNRKTARQLRSQHQHLVRVWKFCQWRNDEPQLRKTNSSSGTNYTALIIKLITGNKRAATQSSSYRAEAVSLPWRTSLCLPGGFYQSFYSSPRRLSPRRWSCSPCLFSGDLLASDYCLSSPVSWRETLGRWEQKFPSPGEAERRGKGVGTGGSPAQLQPHSKSFTAVCQEEKNVFYPTYP